MFAKSFSFGGLAALAAAALLLIVAPGQATPPIGFRFYHYGGFYRPPLRYYGAYNFYRPHYHVYRPSYGGYPSYGFYAGGYDPYDIYNPDNPSFWAFHNPPKPPLTAEEKDVRALMAASGVPTDEGQPVWPVALRALPGQEAEALRGQIDALLQAAATQAARGRPNPDIVQELAQATDRLRKLLLQHREERGGFAQTSYEDAGRFLDKVRGAGRLLRIELAPTPSGSRDGGKGGRDAPDYRP